MFSFPIAALESQVARFFARICARAIFSGVTRIQTHNLNLARTLPYHWAIPSHVTNKQICWAENVLLFLFSKPNKQIQFKFKLKDLNSH